MSDWITIDRLGLKGIEPDMMPVHRDPNSLDTAVNVRALGSNLANAGGYRLLPNGALPAETTPSVCACPDQHYQNTNADGEYHIDRSWIWDWSIGLDRYFQIYLLQAATGTADFDQTWIFRAGDCEGSRLNRCEIRALNTPSARRIQAETFNDAGVSQGLQIDYDATTEFTDGNPHWLVIDRRAGYPNVNLDDNGLGSVTWSTSGETDFISVLRENSPSGLLLPIAIWKYGITIWDCLTSGSFNGLGRCTLTGAQDPPLYDQARSSIDLLYRRGGAVVTAKTGPATPRNAYPSILPVGGKVYWEHMAGAIPNTLCRGNQIAGGCSRALDLGTTLPGQVDQSFGLQSDGNVFVDGVLVAGSGSPILTWSKSIFAYDAVAKQVWIGEDEADSQVWLPGDPATTPGYPTTVTDMLPVSHLNTTNEQMRIISGPGCKFDPPAGFGYLVKA